MPSTSLARVRRRASEKKWPEARSWCERRHLNKSYVLRTKGKPDPTPAGRRSGPPHGTTSSSQGMLSRACTSRARITDRTTTAGGATRKKISVLNRRGTICSSTVISGKTSRGERGGGGGVGGACGVVTRMSDSVVSFCFVLFCFVLFVFLCNFL